MIQQHTHRPRPFMQHRSHTRQQNDQVYNAALKSELDRIIANAEGAPAAASDPELEAAVTAAEATWVKPRTRENSKQAEVIRMLQRPEGATIQQIIDATGWQAKTVRGTFAGTLKKKLRLTLVSAKPQGGERIYRIA